MKYSPLIFSFSLFFLFGMTLHAQHDHGSHGHGKKNTKSSRAHMTSNINQNPATTDIIDAYLDIKTALAADNKNGAAAGANKLLMAFEYFDTSELGKAQKEDYNEIAENAIEQAEHIIKSPMDHQRMHFEVLSADINDLVALLGTNKTLYEAYCPMAARGEGAAWLTETEEITNPYFGSKMLKCGKVQRKIN